MAKLNSDTKADYEEGKRLFKKDRTSETDKERIWVARPIRQDDTPADYERWFINTFSELEPVVG